MATNTAHATQRTEREHLWIAAMWLRTRHTQHNAPREHTGEQEQSDPGHRTRNVTHQAGTSVNRSQEAQDTAHRTHRTHHARTPMHKRQGAVDTGHTVARRAAEGRETTNHKPHRMGRAHWGDQAEPTDQQQGRYPKAAGPSPARLHQGSWQTSPRATETTGDRPAGTHSRRGLPARQRGPATQATGVRRSYR